MLLLDGVGFIYVNMVDSKKYLDTASIHWKLWSLMLTFFQNHHILIDISKKDQ